MGNQENGISLGQLFSIFKKSLVRGLIYILVSVICVTAVLVLVQSFTSTNSYQSTITFSAANNTLLSSMNLNKSKMVNKALVDSGKSLDLSDNVVKNLSITAVVPESANTEDKSFIPTSFNVSLKNASELKLTPAEYTSLLDGISKSYVNQFAANDMPELSDDLIDVDALLTNNNEYIQIAYAITDVIDNYYLSSINSFIAENQKIDEFTDATGKKLSNVIIEFNYVKDTVNALKYNIISNKYGKGNLSSYLDTAKSMADVEVAKYKKIYDGAKAVLDTYQATVQNITQNTNGNNVYHFDDTGFLTLSKNTLAASEKYAESTRKQAEFEGFVTSVGGATGTQNTATENSLKASAQSLNNALSSYKTLSQEFNNDKTSIPPAAVTPPAAQIKENPISTKVIIIADVAVLLIAFFVAFGQTYSVMKKKGQLN